MLRPYEMTRVIITGPDMLKEKVIKEFHRLRILHIVEYSKTDLADIGTPLESANRLSEMIVKVRGIITALNIKKKEIKSGLKVGMTEINHTIKSLNEQVTLLSEQLRQAEELISKSEDLKQELEILKNVNIPLESFGPYKSLACFTGNVRGKNKVASLKGQLSKITKKFMLFESSAKNSSFIVLFIDAKSKADANKILQKNNFSPVNFTCTSSLKGSASGNLAKVERECAKLRRQRDNTKKQMEKLGREHKGFLLATDKFLSQELGKAESPLKFAATKNAFLIKGWVPKEKLDNTIAKLNKACRNKIFIYSERAKKTDKVPVKLKNQKYVKPFEFFIDLYSLPKYGEIDPTFFIFLIFPLLFGFMLGDVGYGIVTLIFAALLRKKIPKMKMFFDVIIFSSIATIFFGMLFGEVFGEEVLFGMELPHVLSRAHQVDALIGISIIIGILHLIMGLIIGFVDVYKEHGLKHAIFEKSGWILLFPGLTKLIIILDLLKGNLGKAIGSILPNNTIIIALAIIGVIFIIMGEGIRGAVELPGIFSNIISYARLMAIGLASVMLAIVINDIAKELFHGGILLILAGILVLVVGHTINIAIGWLGCFLQSLRLHYVEFFTKFFQGGAERYSPFGEIQ